MRQILIQFIRIAAVIVLCMIGEAVQAQVMNDENRMMNSEAYLGLKNYQQAYDILFSVQTSSLRSEYLIASACLYLNKCEEAALHFRSAIKKDTQDERSFLALSFIGLGRALMELKNYPAAIDTFNVVIQEHGANLDLRYPFFEHYEYQDVLEKKIHFIADDAQFLIGECYEKLDDRQSALNAFAKISRFYPFSSKSGDANTKMDEYLR